MAAARAMIQISVYQPPKLPAALAPAYQMISSLLKKPDKPAPIDDPGGSTIGTPVGEPDMEIEEPKPTGIMLKVESTPEGAKILVDGKDTGKTTPVAPRSKIPLKPGRHKITFVVDGKKFNYRVTRQDHNRPRPTLLAKGYTVHAAVTREGKLVRLPEDIMASIQSLVELPKN